MGNPYYIPRQNTFTKTAFGLADLGTRLYGIKERSRLEQGRQGIAKDQLKETAKRTNIMSEDLELQKGAAQREQEAHDAKMAVVRTRAVALSPYDSMKVTKAKAALSVVDQQYGTKLIQACQSASRFFEGLDGKGFTNYDALQYARKNWAGSAEQKQFFLDINKERMRLMALGKEGEPGLMKLEEVARDLGADGVPDVLFAKSVEFEANERAATRATQLGKETWGDLKKDEYGNIVQQSSTGKFSRVSSPTKGMEITTIDGTTIRTGVTSGDMQKGTQKDLEKTMIATTEGLARLGEIAGLYKPEFQEIPTKLGLKWTEIKNKMGVDIPEEDRGKLEEFGAYRQDALDNINRSIKEMTGAQMSHQEAKRLRKGVPDPGEGIFDGDSPAVFQSKIVRKYKQLKAVQMRTAYYMKQGIKSEVFNDMVKNDMLMSIDKMESLIEKKGQAYEAELKKQNPSITTADLFAQVKQRLAEEFGTGSQ